jgi:hypothetical protein
MNNNAAKGFDHKEITKRILWTIGRIKRLVTQRIAGEQFALQRGAVSSPAAAQRTASVSQNADPDLRPRGGGSAPGSSNLVGARNDWAIRSAAD